MRCINCVGEKTPLFNLKLQGGSEIAHWELSEIVRVSMHTLNSASTSDKAVSTHIWDILCITCRLGHNHIHNIMCSVVHYT